MSDSSDSSGRQNCGWRFRSYSTLILILFALILFGAAITFAQTPLRANGKIAFTSNRDGNQEIYLMNNDGSKIVFHRWE